MLENINHCHRHCHIHSLERGNLTNRCCRLLMLLTNVFNESNCKKSSTGNSRSTFKIRM